jgi:hypothetical protein
VRNILLILILIFTLVSCQKEDILSNQYEKNLTDSITVNDTINKKIKLYEIVNKVNKKEPVKSRKKKRFKFKEFIKSKFKKG